MEKILTIIFIFGFLFELFMISPFGVALMIKQLNSKKGNCSSIIGVVVVGIILIVIGDYLGFML